MREVLDVLVVGGGPAGIPAAVQSARLGARTGLVEKNGALGGTTTVAGVSLPGLFHAWGRQVIAGIGWDMVERSVRIAGGRMPDFSRWDLPHYRLQVRVSAPIYAAVADETVVDAGVDLLLHTMLADARWVGDAWRVALCSKEGIHEVHARRIVDCTGDADVVAHAGLARRSTERKQPGTLMVRLGGYDLDAIDLERLDRAYDRAIEQGELRASDFQSTEHPLGKFLRHRGENAIHVTDIHGGTSFDRTDAELAGRRALMRIFGFLKRQEGLEGLTIDSWAIECGVRETFTIDGHTTIGVDDYASGRRWDDAVSHSFYPIDVHRSDGDGIDVRPLAYGTLPSIPRAAMLPKGSPGSLIVAGRAISGDQEANSAYRVQAPCMAMGQAAGALAALSLEGDLDVEEVPMPVLHETLRAAGAIVPGDVEIPAAETDAALAAAVSGATPRR